MAKRRWEREHRLLSGGAREDGGQKQNRPLSSRKEDGSIEMLFPASEMVGSPAGTTVDNMVQPFGSEEHQQGEKQKIEGIQPDGNVGGDQSEKGRHESGAYISAGHLNPDDSLGILLAEMCIRDRFRGIFTILGRTW